MPIEKKNRMKDKRKTISYSNWGQIEGLKLNQCKIPKPRLGNFMKAATIQKRLSVLNQYKIIKGRMPKVSMQEEVPIEEKLEF